MSSAVPGPPDDVLGYKPFIDGLRAVAVIAVVAYHAGIPGVESGFIGVDVFFVISGFLIINQIVFGLGAGTFAFREFWARRVLRILPPYLLVVGACLVMAPFVQVTPAEFEELGREAQYSALMVVNYYFQASKGYFDVSAELKPLLHLWSLSVEEQFYLVAPLILFALWWASRRLGQSGALLWTIAIGVVVIVSFVACVLGSSGSNQAFFLMPFRAWQFALGGMVPLAVPWVRRALPGLAIEVLAVAGIVLIVVAAGWLGDVSYPYYFAALPVAGACLVILAGLANPRNLVARVLASGPFVWVGLISYAWYLWHWPLLSFGAIHNFGESPAVWRWGAIALSLVLAAATHHWLEAPIRRWRIRERRPLGWGVAGIGAVAAVSVSLVGASYVHLLAPAVEQRLASAGLAVEADWTFLSDRCSITESGALSAECLTAEQDGRFGVLIGNSHARMIYAAVDEASETAGRELISLIKIACVPFYLTEALATAGLKDKCHGFYGAGARTLSALPLRPAFAIISARWNNKDQLDRNIRADPEGVLAAAGLKAPAPEGLLMVMALGLAGFVEEIETWQTARILLVGPMPEFRHPAAECLARADYRGMSPNICAMPRSRVEKRRERTMITLDYLASQFPNLRVLDPLEMFCGPRLCRPYDDGGILFTDGDHLSLYGARRLLETFEADFAWAIGR